MPRVLPNGAGQLTGDTLAVNGPLFLSGRLWYVHHTGADAASPRGLSPEYPLATLGQAVTNAASGDIVVLMDGHTETIVTRVSFSSKQITIVGGGYSSGMPTAKLTDGVVGDNMLSSAPTGALSLRNIRFMAPSVAKTAAPTVDLSAVGSVIGCRFECNRNDQAASGRCLAISSAVQILNTTFISVETDKTQRPVEALVLNSGASGLIRSCTFDGGTVGWDTYAMSNSSTNIILSIEELTLLRGSDISIITGTAGYVSLFSASGGSRVDWL